ncbi:tRNA-specific adenosine deaminase 1 [Leptopilina heterotoma]|uniref:tRNA-specific adenosine deaminase 1 n=1 Tax=Leptopilina heterotoma TaxID=63436 RepID=UPI001CA7BA96|nr:tRNA-specific adenosine deaminase 1 [Leptopilina heterotoma]
MLEFANKIAKLCLDKYKTLKKTGKPTANEWTVLSGIILENNKQLTVVALCTGTKCLSGRELITTKIDEIGNKLSDSHAEILARRAFQRYLYSQIELIMNSKESDVFFKKKEGKIECKENVSFHFFSSQTPCGDCSIIPKRHSNSGDDNGREIKKMKLNESEKIEETIEFENDIHRTGAKCINNDERQDLHLSGENYHVVGPLRTKPGRGDRTMSLSCSDKMAKWNVVGIQGSLLSLLIPEIKLKTIIIGGNCPFSLEAMERGLFKRFDNSTGPRIFQSSFSFDEIKGETRQNPCPSSIIWCSVSERNLEIAVNGKKQGVTKKKSGIYLLVSRRGLFKIFMKIYDKHSKDIELPQHPKKITYQHCKNWSHSYRNLWHEAKITTFDKWPTKPLSLQNFIL